MPGSLTCLGGGHGLFQTLRAGRHLDIDRITAVVTVADDGGSSGRIRKELGQIPPGDLRMALAALSRDSDEGRLWEETLQHRFGGYGALAGHAVGNLLIAGLTDVLGSQVQALDAVAALTQSHGRVLPVCEQPLEIEAEVAGLGDEPMSVRPVRGQVAVASTTGNVRRVRLFPENPPGGSDAIAAILSADMVTLGPGSWFTSVIPHILVPDITRALTETDACRVVILNLTAEPGETAGFSTERHIHMLTQHAPELRVDHILIDATTITSEVERRYLARAAATIGADVTFEPVRADDGNGGWVNRHDPVKLASALQRVYTRHVSAEPRR
ncbi:uridine diphosphate-N-acetylglucosamine-binding protein YvcK [Corynebacterium sp. CCM 9187]|uniref:Putative gluconeogenesis factor n=2 Tax=Corynebacterium pygosceleis TaxID=2800406 RepID=A0A9Q4C715_9CORY|nr:uridine diphosphate-N-acetylglucosamine-binding protein YvcK [Corynebacterium pygosceleis]MCK7674461.1 uridine diphosphate-N-acetylglucosamine-binding protein YvcK [Corynebacterium pygosceleis]MCL0120241.1 uridine diphosphate-N-acetylglucosamine-binding protein YvcK [Corynebacterium pygosceleis]MCX7443788.1 uridine diphosphate-N-acetylglucosamine-binding protein YvcK [Corynebacterium pygosceleis]MCX7467740.1 uridine diphosphate-N-acetylglucosamine-binding protein YvcK [Corynebacterium pygosc